MDFILLTLGLLVLLFVMLLLTARLFRDYSVRDLLDWQPTRSPEVEAQNELDDIQQMIDAQNEYRRKRGAKEITEADAHRQAREDEDFRARGRGPFAQGGGLDDEEEAKPPPAKRKPRSTKKPGSTRKPRASKKS
jgi:hypothetical protein